MTTGIRLEARARAMVWLATALLFIPATASTQAWRPDRPVEIIIGTSPGGPQDRTGRTIQRILQEQKLVPTPVNIVNRAGGGGAVGLNNLNQLEMENVYRNSADTGRYWKLQNDEVRGVLTELGLAR